MSCVTTNTLQCPLFLLLCWTPPHCVTLNNVISRIYNIHPGLGGPIRWQANVPFDVFNAEVFRRGWKANSQGESKFWRSCEFRSMSEINLIKSWRHDNILNDIYRYVFKFYRHFSPFEIRPYNAGIHRNNEYILHFGHNAIIVTYIGITIARRQTISPIEAWLMIAALHVSLNAWLRYRKLWGLSESSIGLRYPLGIE